MLLAPTSAVAVAVFAQSGSHPTNPRPLPTAVAYATCPGAQSMPITMRARTQVASWRWSQAERRWVPMV